MQLLMYFNLSRTYTSISINIMLTRLSFSNKSELYVLHVRDVEKENKIVSGISRCRQHLDSSISICYCYVRGLIDRQQLQIRDKKHADHQAKTIAYHVH